MDPLLSFPLMLFSLFLCLLVFLLFKLKTYHSKSSLRLPPGPWPLPVIGNIHNVFRSLPHHGMRDLSRRYGPIMLLHLGETPTVVVSSPDAAREVMKTHDINFASRPISTTMSISSFGGKGIVFPPYGEYWRYIRKLCVLELLSTKRVQSYRSIREEEVGNLINSIFSSASHRQPVDLSRKLTLVTNDIITRAIIGSKRENQDVFLRELDLAVKLSAGFNLVDLFPSSWLARLFSRAAKQAEKSLQVKFHYLDEIIKQHKQTTIATGKNEVDDLLGVLLRLHEEDALTNHLDMETIKILILVSHVASLKAFIRVHFINTYMHTDIYSKKMLITCIKTK
jgi:cytochrome P450